MESIGALIIVMLVGLAPGDVVGAVGAIKTTGRARGWVLTLTFAALLIGGWPKPAVNECDLSLPGVNCHPNQDRCAISQKSTVLIRSPKKSPAWRGAARRGSRVHLSVVGGGESDAEGEAGQYVTGIDCCCGMLVSA